METNQRKVGRPNAPPRTGPLVLGDDRARTKVTLEISESAAAELAEYTRWVGSARGCRRTRRGSRLSISHCARPSGGIGCGRRSNDLRTRKHNLLQPVEGLEKNIALYRLFFSICLSGRPDDPALVGVDTRELAATLKAAARELARRARPKLIGRFTLPEWRPRCGSHQDFFLAAT